MNVVDAFATKVGLRANADVEADDGHHYGGWQRGDGYDLSDGWVRGGLVPPAARVGPTLAAGGLHRDVDGSTSARSSRARSPRPRTPPASRGPLLAASSPRQPRSPRDSSRSAAVKPSSADVPRCDLPPAHDAAGEAPRRRALKPRTMSYHGAPAVPKRPRGAGATALKPAQRPAAKPSAKQKPRPAPRPAPKPAARVPRYRPPAAWQPARVDHSAEIADHLSKRLGEAEKLLEELQSPAASPSEPRVTRGRKRDQPLIAALSRIARGGSDAPSPPRSPRASAVTTTPRSAPDEIWSPLTPSRSQLQPPPSPLAHAPPRSPLPSSSPRQSTSSPLLSSPKQPPPRSPLVSSSAHASSPRHQLPRSPAQSPLQPQLRSPVQSPTLQLLRSPLHPHVSPVGPPTTPPLPPSMFAENRYADVSSSAG